MACVHPKGETLQVVDTDLFADSTEWCPLENVDDFLLCGTYQLRDESNDQVSDSKTQIRVGSLRIYQLQDFRSHNPHLALRHKVDMPGILDIKWYRCKLAGKPTWGLVNSVGQLQVWQLDGNETPHKLFNEDLGEPCLGLSLDWSQQGENSDSPTVVTSDSAGALTVFKIGSDLSVINRWKAHDFEAWICAFDSWDNNIIYSGSDDCKLKGWDLRVGETPIFTNQRHQMGVCSIESNPFKEHILAVGSYDEDLDIWDTRQLKRPMSTVSLGGGVWRIRWDPFAGETILTASMHNGFHLVDCSKPDEEWPPVLVNYSHNGSLAYGADWCRIKISQPFRQPFTQPSSDWVNASHVTSGDDDDKGVPEQYLFATCSFYDHSLHLWRWPS